MGWLVQGRVNLGWGRSWDIVPFPWKDLGLRQRHILSWAQGGAVTAAPTWRAWRTQSTSQWNWPDAWVRRDPVLLGHRLSGIRGRTCWWWRSAQWWALHCYRCVSKEGWPRAEVSGVNPRAFPRISAVSWPPDPPLAATGASWGGKDLGSPVVPACWGGEGKDFLWVSLDRPLGFPGGTGGKEPTCQHRRHKRCGFDPWVGKIPWKRAWQPTPVFLPGESHGQRTLAD